MSAVMHVVSWSNCLLAIIILSTQTQAASVQTYNLYNKYTASDGIASSLQTSLRQAKWIGSAPETNKKKAEFTSPVDGYFIQVSSVQDLTYQPRFAMSHWYHDCPGACFKGSSSTWTAQKLWGPRTLEASLLSLEQRYILPIPYKPVAFFAAQEVAWSGCNCWQWAIAQSTTACCTCRHKAPLPDSARPGVVKLP